MAEKRAYSECRRAPGSGYCMEHNALWRTDDGVCDARAQELAAERVDRSKSKFDSDLAERAYEQVLDGVQAGEQIMIGEEIAYDLVAIDDLLVILHTSDQGFVSVYAKTPEPVMRLWGQLRRTYAGL